MEASPVEEALAGKGVHEGGDGDTASAEVGVGLPLGQALSQGGPLLLLPHQPALPGLPQAAPPPLLISTLRALHPSMYCVTDPPYILYLWTACVVQHSLGHMSASQQSYLVCSGAEISLTLLDDSHAASFSLLIRPHCALHRGQN